MISDVLCDAVGRIDCYLSDETYGNAYEGELRKEIKELRDHMEKVRIKLDMPPDVEEMKRR
jgi:hypothetical protein